jgi:hypothetical protein
MWPLNHEVSETGLLQTYRPKNDFGLWMDQFPRLLVEVQSTDSDCGSDYNRLKFQGAAVVKIASAILRKQCSQAKRGEKEKDDDGTNFFLLVLYLRRRGPAETLLMFEKGSEVSDHISSSY